jgi:hypothetical protein
LEGPKAEASPVKLSDEEIAAIQELPKDDQAVALAQGVCPISDGNLGAMGKPVKITLEGKTVFLCCESCESEAKDDPAGVLAKLNQNKKK